jgi:hypothetical protein
MTNDSDPSKQELLDRVEQLESTVEKMLPSRRQALKLGAAGAASVGGVSMLSDSADASTGSAGQIGDPQNRPDLFADTVDLNQLSGVATGGALSGVRAFLSTTSTSSPVPFDTIGFEFGSPSGSSLFDTSSHEYVAPADGIYQMNVHVRLDSSGANTRLRVQNSTTSTQLTTIKENTQTSLATLETQLLVQLSNGDRVRVNNGFNVSLFSGRPSTYIEVIRVD